VPVSHAAAPAVLGYFAKDQDEVIHAS